MQMIKNLQVKEEVYIEKLENGLTVMVIPKKETLKKYVIWGTNFGSIDNHFLLKPENEEVQIPDGVAHFLEHKLFEQENGTNSLDVLSSLGVDANAYTTNDHTAYLFEANSNFYEALDELMNYVQNPYFTDENVEKEKGIIGQEINMYEDDPEWQVYMNAMKLMYKVNPINIDIAGSIESISKIDKEVLYKAYHNFYDLSNMLLVVCGDFKPEEILEEVKKRITKTSQVGEVQRIYETEPEEIVEKEKTVNMEVSMPIYAIGFKDKPEENKVKKCIAVQILLYLLLGKSSEGYQTLYNNGDIIGQPSLDYEFSKQYSHVLISGGARNPQKIVEMLKTQIQKFKKSGLNEDDFERVKKKIYGDYISEYGEVGNIARMFLSDYFKGINSFDYLEQYRTVTKEYAQQVLNDVFDENKMVVSIVKGKE
ncbi:MAG: insulinase family protein [Clostridia bacterium]|jgi:predicted Zn-dependent peptidase|nr:insulinase family protein [Clostridia bacterium]